jgi:hypothetical protein
MINRLYRYTGRVLQRQTIVTTRTEWVEPPPESVVPPITPPIIAVTPPLVNPIAVGWIGMGFINCLASDGRSGQMIVQYTPDGGYLRASDCLANDELWP